MAVGNTIWIHFTGLVVVRYHYQRDIVGGQNLSLSGFCSSTAVQKKLLSQ